MLSRTGLVMLCCQLVISKPSGQSLLRFKSSQKVAFRVVLDCMQLMPSSAKTPMVKRFHLVCD